MCADVTSPELKISENSVDLIFSNWLLMYLSDIEVNYIIYTLYYFFISYILVEHALLFLTHQI